MAESAATSDRQIVHPTSERSHYVSIFSDRIFYDPVGSRMTPKKN